MTAIAFSPKIGPVALSIVINESHSSEIAITSNPIESGSDIHDHSFIRPKKLSLEVAGENAADTFNSLVDFQRSRVPFTIVTGLTVYNNMMITSINSDRNKSNANIFSASVELQEVIIVDTAVISVDVNDAGEKSNGKGGGDNSVRAATPTSDRSSDDITKDRASGTLQRGDSPTQTADSAKLSEWAEGLQ